MFDFYHTMFINPISTIKYTMGVLSLVATSFLPISSGLKAREANLESDTFTYVGQVPTKGTSKASVLSKAPSPRITVAGEKKLATIVVDLSQNVLYHYNEKGDAVAAYLVASGKKSSPTDKGLRVVKNIETYPYKTAPLATKRRKNPRDYGPKILILEKVNPKTGARSSTGEFIHGNNNPKSLGKYVSLGCIRMDNEVIKKLAKQVKRGSYVLIK